MRASPSYPQYLSPPRQTAEIFHGNTGEFQTRPPPRPPHPKPGAGNPPARGGLGKKTPHPLWNFHRVLMPGWIKLGAMSVTRTDAQGEEIHLEGHWHPVRVYGRQGLFQGPARIPPACPPLCSGVSENHAQFQRTSVGTFMKTLGGFRPARLKYI